MSKLITTPKFWLAIVLVSLLFVIGFVGGGLGEIFFGTGFLVTPIHIEVAAETLYGPIFSVGPLGEFLLTNTMVATWATIIVVGSIAYFSTRRLTLVPKRAQALLELVIDGFLQLVEGIAGKDRARQFFPLIMTIFLFVLISNWMGILPGYNTIGFIHDADEVIETAREHHEELHDIHFQVFDKMGGLNFVPFKPVKDRYLTAEEIEEGHLPVGSKAGVLIPFFRSTNTDLNTPLALALVAMIMVQFWGIRSKGFFSYASQWVNVGRLIRGIRTRSVGDFANGLLDAFTGFLEFISEIARVISFTFRLFGNIFAGEILVFVALFLFPLPVLVLVFGFELFVGMIQAFIFSILTLVFATMATSSHGSEEDGH